MLNSESFNPNYLSGSNNMYTFAASKHKQYSYEQGV